MGTIATTDKNLNVLDNVKRQVQLARPRFEKMAIGKNFDEFYQNMVFVMHETYGLEKCTAKTIFNSIYAMAALGLSPHKTLGEAYIIPYGEDATLVIGYKGFVKLAKASGLVKGINCGAVHENDEFDFQLGSNAYIRHRPNLKQARGESYAFYCIISMNDGTEQIEVMNRAEIEIIRNTSKSYQGAQRSKNPSKNPWISNFDEMAKKTVFRRASKWVGLSQYKPLMDAITVDNTDYTNEVIDVATTDNSIDINAIAKEKEEQVKELQQDESKRLNDLLNQQAAIEAQ